MKLKLPHIDSSGWLTELLIDWRKCKEQFIERVRPPIFFVSCQILKYCRILIIFLKNATDALKIQILPPVEVMTGLKGSEESSIPTRWNYLIEVSMASCYLPIGLLPWVKRLSN